MKPITAWFILMAACIPFFSGCVSLPSLQHPQVLAPREMAVGCGFSYVGGSGPMGEGSARVGLGRNFDVGLRTDAYTTFFRVDLRYQVISDPLFASAGLGWSRIKLNGIEGTPGYIVKNAFDPSFIVGQENWYVGVRTLSNMESGKFEYLDAIIDRSVFSAVSLTTGASIKYESERILLEFNYMFLTRGQRLLVPALGIQAVF